MATAIAADSADQAALGQARWEAAAVVSSAQNDASQFGSRAELQKASSNANDADQICRFAGTVARPNMFRNGDATQV